MDLFLKYLSQPYLLTGIVYTIVITFGGLVGGSLMGIVLSAMQLSRFRALAVVARIYAIIFRGTPLILQMVFAYNALPLIGIKLSALEAAVLALTFNEAPFIAEIIRANVLGVDRGQTSAGQALGMRPAAIMRRVVAPQAFRMMVPALGNEAVSALKNSSLASVISVQELTLRSTQLASSTFDFFSIFFASGLMYIVLAGLIALVQILIEVALDLDRPDPRQRLAALMPWIRRELAPAPTAPLATGEAIATEAESAEAEPEPESDPEHLPPLDRAARERTLASAKVVLQIDGLVKSYEGKRVLDGLDLEVRQGEIVALLGPSGSGKSTLLRCINRLEGWDSGRIKVLGRHIGLSGNNVPLSPREIADARAEVGIGMVFQNFNLFGHLTARENIAGPLRWVQHVPAEQAARRADDLLDRVGLSHRADALPRHLSGGQQQRVAIARALASNPQMLLLDEPTSALDPELVAGVLGLIRRLAEEDGLTMLISTHQIGFARDVADRAIFLDGGHIVEDGRADRMLSHPENPRTARFLRVLSEDAPIPA
ncbi:amino acid ABC transporter permease/ATP-binding protein [Acidimangrovimonas sediminis]|uniref:amino acid ABC transporter permease/ATP-binding protein n=1 Tax=Acidimangrovimonas sediminis TaxID=2056283 RepID=UPI000C7FCE67|nr:amino acid ABC transporter permease/ATP-binding protein [Acidimangrovimonas sediminis]